MIRRVTQPGPAPADRLQLVPCGAVPITATLRDGIPLEEAVAEAMAAPGYRCGWLEIVDAPVTDLAYVMPDHARDADHVAWYSPPETFTGGCIARLGMIVGRHDGGSFLHGHGVWAPHGAAPAMGHVLAPGTVLARPATARGFGVRGAMFQRGPDPETRFDLFHAVPVPGADPPGTAAILRVRPNEDLTGALAASCRALGWSRARVWGVGSINTPVFADGRVLHSLPTDVLISDAAVTGAGRTGPDLAAVGVAGCGMMNGAIAPGQNAVLITAELVLRRG